MKIIKLILILLKKAYTFLFIIDINRRVAVSAEIWCGLLIILFVLLINLSLLANSDYQSNQNFILANEAHNIKEFNSIIELQTSDSIKNGDIVKTLGYYSPNDGGSSYYEITSNPNNVKGNNDYLLQINKSYFARYIQVSKEVNIKQFGVRGDGITDDSEITQNVLNKFTNVVFPSGNYLLHNIIINNNATKIQFINSKIQLKYYSSIKNTFKNVFTIKNVSNIEIKGLQIEGSYVTTQQKTKKDPVRESIIDCESCNDLKLINAKVSNIYMKNSDKEKEGIIRKGGVANFINCKNVLIKDSEFYNINYTEWFDGYEKLGGKNTVVIDNCKFGKNEKGCSITSIRCSELSFTNNHIINYKYTGSLLNLLATNVTATNNYIDNSQLKEDENTNFNCVFDVSESGMFASKKIFISNNTFLGKSRVFIKCTSDHIEVKNNTADQVDKFITFVSQSNKTINPLVFEKNIVKIIKNNIKGGIQVLPSKKEYFINIGYKSNLCLNNVELVNNKFDLIGNEMEFLMITNSKFTNISNNTMSLCRTWSSNPQKYNYGCITNIISEKGIGANTFILKNNNFFLPNTMNKKADSITYYNEINHFPFNKTITNFIGNRLESVKTIKTERSKFNVSNNIFIIK